MKISLQTSYIVSRSTCDERGETNISPNLSLILGHNGGDVVLDGRGQGGLVADVADPTGQLRVPDKGVAANGLVVGGGPVDQVVGALEVEGALGALGTLPLHAVLRRDLAEVGVDDGRVLAGRKPVLVRAGAKVHLALGLHQRVDALRGLARADILYHRRRHRRQRRQQEQESRLHDGRAWVLNHER